jgi:hypothetical protein
MTDQLQLHGGATADLLRWVQDQYKTIADDFERAETFSRRMGAHYTNGLTTIGWWLPELVQSEVAACYLEVLDPVGELDLLADKQTITFQRRQAQLKQHNDYAWGVVQGMTAGTRDQLGSLYWVRLHMADGSWRTRHDHFAYSVPFGVLAPAELYDMDGMFAGRSDAHHFANLPWDQDEHHQLGETKRIAPPTNILQIHPGTASADGTLAGLTEIYAGIAAKIEADEPLAPWEENFVGYDAVELMPIEPPIEHEAGPLFWEATDDDPTNDTLSAQLRKHNIIDWGYDVMVSASPAVNPAVLRSKRPDELLDLIVTLHNFPTGPIYIMFDIVYGHTDNQAVQVFHPDYLAGPNMYGQNLSYTRPAPRATWLEMQRRKNNYGIDGVRVDGAQDFKNWNPEKWVMEHDDDFLRQMNFITQEAAGQPYYPYMIFEDGRPWPREDWELASSYLEINKQMPNVWQWGPLTFAHNTPFLFTFWMNKWWRVQEMAAKGKYWITGCANHDTLRRGTQVRIDERINSRLGNTLPETFRNAYDNPAHKLFDYAMMPGIPMDFVNASMRAPWGFIRNTDDRYGVKVVSEEARFLHWAMWPERFAEDEVFVRLKALGFTDLAHTRYFFTMLDHLIQATNNDLEQIARVMNSHEPSLAGPDLSPNKLKAIAAAWMADVWDYCNLSRYYDTVEPKRSDYNRRLRAFRRARPWLRENLRADEFLGRRQPANGTAFYYGLRIAPDGSESILFCSNMEGEPVTFIPTTLPILGLPTDGWQLALSGPHMADDLRADNAITLEDSQAVVFVRGQ